MLSLGLLRKEACSLLAGRDFHGCSVALGGIKMVFFNPEKTAKLPFYCDLRTGRCEEWDEERPFQFWNIELEKMLTSLKRGEVEYF